MITPPKFGVVVTQPTEFVERNPDSIEHTRRGMERDILDSGRLPDQASWKREDRKADYAQTPMTRFSLDALSQAHVIAFVDYSNGFYAVSSRVHEVLVGHTAEEVQERVDALNEEHGHTERDEEDGEWFDSHFTFKTVPMVQA